MKTKTAGRLCAWLVLSVGICHLSAAPARAELDTSDPSVINLYLLNEQSSGVLDNSFVSFFDTAPTGIPQNHDTFECCDPTWGSGALFESGGQPVGTGTGLIFIRDQIEHTRHAVWMNVPQGNYSDGGDFSVMTRIYATEAVDDRVYHVLGRAAHYIALTGTSFGGLAVTGQVRGGVPNETFWTERSAVGGTSGTTFFMDTNKWYNVFMI